MKVLIPILIGLLVVGCGKEAPPAYPDTGDTGYDTENPQNETPPTKPTKVAVENKKLKEEIIGAYESGTPYGAFSYVFRSNGMVSYYHDGNRIDDFKWSIVGNEIHTVIDNKLNQGYIYIKNPDNGLTQIAAFDKGERLEAGPTIGTTWKKIKQSQPIGLPPSKGDDNNSITAKPVKVLKKADVVGTYELKHDKDTYRYVLLANGTKEDYENGEKEKKEYKWKIVEGELHYTNGDIHEPWSICRINSNVKNAVGFQYPSSLTLIAHLSAKGERRVIPKWGVFTYKKIK